MTTVINLLGGSGLGKSTTAADCFRLMKFDARLCELVREFVKEWAWEGKKVGEFGQSVIYGHQLERESSLYGAVDYIVTDSPLLLCVIYQQFYGGHEAIKHTVFKDLDVAKHKNVNHVNFVLKRTKPFDTRGRYETKELAMEVDDFVNAFLNYHKIPHIFLDCLDEERPYHIMNCVDVLHEDTLENVSTDAIILALDYIEKGQFRNFSNLEDLVLNLEMELGFRTTLPNIAKGDKSNIGLYFY